MVLSESCKLNRNASDGIIMHSCFDCLFIMRSFIRIKMPGLIFRALLDDAQFQESCHEVINAPIPYYKQFIAEKRSQTPPPTGETEASQLTEIELHVGSERGSPQQGQQIHLSKELLMFSSFLKVIVNCKVTELSIFLFLIMILRILTYKCWSFYIHYV